MRRSWFRRWGWVYRPVSWEGVAVLALAAVFCLPVVAVVDRRSPSVGDTLYGVFAFVVPCFLLIDWIASKTSEGRRRGRRLRPDRERLLD